MRYCNLDDVYTEMHYLAYVYHWERDTVWNIPRSERKIWVDKIIKQKEAEVKAIKNDCDSSSSYDDDE
jgi:hypothetical protein